jgi:hypothetical protein
MSADVPHYQLWASELGYSFSKELGWDANAPVLFFNMLTDAGYCFHSRMIVGHTCLSNISTRVPGMDIPDDMMTRAVILDRHTRVALATERVG